MIDLALDALFVTGIVLVLVGVYGINKYVFLILIGLCLAVAGIILHLRSKGP